MDASAPQALGYVGVRAKDLADWASYGSGLLGLQRIDKSRSTLAFRMDDRKQRIIISADGGEGLSFFGWEVADATALDAIAAEFTSAHAQNLDVARLHSGDLSIYSAVAEQTRRLERLGIPYTLTPGVPAFSAAAASSARAPERMPSRA